MGFVYYRGMTLIEVMVFVVVVSIAMVALLRVFNSSVVASVDPGLRIRAIHLAQAQLDEILSRRFDENTPTGGVPPCGAISAPACAGITVDDAYDDVGDYDGFVDVSHPGHRMTVSVEEAGNDLGLDASHARLITVVVTYGDDQLTLSAYKVNF